MAKNITLMGASYSDVPAIILPQTGGGTAKFADTSIVTATASDVASGKIFVDASGNSATGTASGGGASNLVTGTFTGVTAGENMAVTIPYTGTGYPLIISIVPTGGGKVIDNLIQRYVIWNFAAAKYNMGVAPAYAGTSTDTDGYSTLAMYKNSTSSASTRSQASAVKALFADTGDPTGSSSATCVLLNSATQITVKIATTYYGFAQNVSYTYNIIYSS